MRTHGSGRLGLGALLTLGLLLGSLAGGAAAQGTPPATGTLTALTGRVELLPQGQAAWQPARLGMAVGAGDELRAFAGGSAEVHLPDGSVVALAENSRVAVTKLEVTPQRELRTALFHLAVGKLRGLLAQAAVRLVQARQPTFAISTPTAVAAIRGSEVYARFDPATGATSFYVSSGTATIVDVQTGQRLTLTAGQILTYTAGQPLPAPAPATAAQQAQMTANAQPPSASGALAQGGPTVVPVSPDQVLAVTAPPAAAAAAPPTVVVTPAPPPLTRETQPSPF